MKKKVLKNKNLLGITLVYKAPLEKSPRQIFPNLKLQIEISGLSIQISGLILMYADTHIFN